MAEWNCSSCTYINWGGNDLCNMCGTPNPQSASAANLGVCGFEWRDGFGNEYIESTAWQCRKCTILNYTGNKYCEVCYSYKDQHKQDEGDSNNELLGWECDECTYFNYGDDKYCQSCDELRHDDTPISTYSMTAESHSGLKTDNDNAVQSCSHSSPIANLDSDAERRILLIGKTGSGKSATGNCILNMNAFHSAASGQSVTSKCQLAQANRFGRNITVVDTPGLFDTNTTNAAVTSEIVKCAEMLLPGPHAVILVIRAGRFTKEEQDTVKHFAENFGEGVFRYMIVMFTGKDELDSEDTSIQEFVNSVPHELQNILKQCGMRYVAFNNRLRNTSQDDQVQELILRINDMLEENGGHFYTNEMLEEAERNARRRLDKTVAEERRKHSREAEQIKRTERRKQRKELAKEMIEKDKLCCLKLTTEWEIEDRDRNNRSLQRKTEQLKDQLKEVQRELDEP